MSYLRRYMRRLSVADFINYTFTPAFGAIQSMGVLMLLVSIVWCALRNKPLYAVSIVCGYTVIFCIVMLSSFIRWKRYRAFQNILKK